jgi:protease-4
VKRKKRYFLELLLKGDIVEGRPEYALFSRRTRTPLHDVLQAIERAAQDRRVAAASLKIENLSSGWARLSNLRRALAKFRDSGKPVYCFLETGGNPEYYLASACDRIYMGPAGSLHLVGLASEVFFFRELLDRVGVEPQILSVGEFKSAGEMFTRTGMSEAAREQWDALLDDYNGELQEAIAVARGFTPEEVTDRINAGPYSAREALRQKLIDGTCYEDEIPEKLRENLGKPLEPVHPRKYLRGDGFIKRWVTFRRPRLAMVDVLGIIASGESRRDNTGRHITGADTLGKFLDHARKSRRINAVVVRVDSPGGTGLASDALWRKMSLLAEQKPVVVSFGDVAASGGYYISAPASAIFAEATTVTGSIGVLGGKFVARELISRLAVHRESIRRGEHSEINSLFAPFSASEAERLQNQLTEFYWEDFVKKVAAGRKMDEDSVDRVGRGRIWSGMRAKAQGLVDRIGGLDDAVLEARRLAKIPDGKKVRLLHYVRRRRLREMLMPDFSPHLETSLLRDSSLDAWELSCRARESTILLLLPFSIRIR